MFDRFVGFQARLRPEAPAIITPSRQVSFAGFDADIDRVAAALGDLGPAAGEAVALAVNDPYRHWLLTLALARRGFASASGNDASCRLRVSDGPADPASDGAETLTLPFEELLATPPKQVPPPATGAPDDVARVLLSSGTTGQAKRVGLTWRIVEAALRNVPLTYRAEQDGRWLALTGPTTILGFVLTLGAWATGNALVLLEDRPLTGDTLRWLRPTLIGMVPFQLADLVASLPKRFPPCPSMTLVTAGSPLPLPLARDARRLLTHDIKSVYGTSECGAVAIADAALLEQTPGAAGYVLPDVELAIVDDRGQPVPAGSAGRIRVRSPRGVSSYLGEADGTATTFAEGWFQPGDIGRLREDGLLIVEGRADDLINLGGHKVLPSLIEREVMTCRGVGEVAAFAVADEVGLDRCWLAIVPTAEFAGHELEACVARNMPWLRNLFWVTVEAIPRNQGGKIDRIELRRAAEAFLARGRAPAS